MFMIVMSKRLSDVSIDRHSHGCQISMCVEDRREVALGHDSERNALSVLIRRSCAIRPTTVISSIGNRKCRNMARVTRAKSE